MIDMLKPDRAPLRWLFGTVELDEANWILTVDGQRVAIEIKPLQLLRELLHRQGSVATKAQLLEAVWPNVLVVEASLTSAMLKLRRALGDADTKNRIIETVPRVGYRFAAVATYRDSPVARFRELPALPQQNPPIVRPRHLTSRVANMIVGLGALAIGVTYYPPPARFGAPTSKPPLSFTLQDAREILNSQDLGRLHALLAAGWNPNAPFDTQNNAALNVLVETCEWNPGHDRRQLLLAARMLIDAGARLDVRNVWGDTPYSIAKAQRFCGPDHPVTQFIHSSCYSGNKNMLQGKCEASYPRDQARKLPS